MSTTGIQNKGLVNKELLDEVFFRGYDTVLNDPYMGSVQDEMIMRQKNTDTGAHTVANFRGPGFFTQRDESEQVTQDSFAQGTPQTFNVLSWDQDQPLAKELFDDAKYDAIGEMLRQLGESGRLSMEKFGMGVYRDAFDGNTYTTNEGSSLVSDTHTNLNGDTVDNKLTVSLTDAGLETAVNALYEQVNQAGQIVTRMPSVLLVPTALFKEAVEVLESELRPGTANNDINYFITKYNIVIKRNPYLGASAGGADDRWFLLGRNHNVMRIQRQGLETYFADHTVNALPQFGRTYLYSAGYREQYGVSSYEDVVGSDPA